MSTKHPFDGEGLTYAQTLEFWDNYASQYSGFQQGDIPRRIVERLVSEGIVDSDSDVLAVGSGPGTYSLELAPKVSSLTCLDTSPRMLDRLFARASELGLTNIRRMDGDWNTHAPSKNYDMCIATLCPGTGSPASMERMEADSKGHCVLVSWLENHGDDLHAEIWRELGRDYGYEGRRSTATQDWLREKGRNPTVEFLSTVVERDFTIEELVEKERASFRGFDVDVDIGEVARSILEPDSDDGIIHYRAENSMKLIFWESPSQG